MKDYFESNKELWDSRVDAHVESAFYGLDAWRQGHCTVPDLDLALLGDLKGKSLLHLQCHFGQDTLSLARLGANVTGADISPAAIAQAQALATELGIDAHFVCCNVLDLKEHLSGTFDIVYTSYGTIGWLPDLEPWASVVSHFLKPGGIFVMAEFHPMMWSLDLETFKIGYHYFNLELIQEESVGSYADTNPAEASQPQFEYTWNHPFAEILTPLLAEGLQLQVFREFDWSPWNCFKDLEETEKGQWKFAKRPKEIPMTYAMRWGK